MKRVRIGLGMCLPASVLAACDPAARTILQVRTRPDPEQAARSRLAVAGLSEAAVIAVVSRVALAHGLDEVPCEPEDVIAFARRWDASGDGHARSVSATVRRRPSAGDPIGIVVHEWLSAGHSRFGDALLADLRRQLERLIRECGVGTLA